jgi:hypothetical protein
MSQTIKALEGYGRVTDLGVFTRGTNVVSKMTGNSKFQNSPVDLAVLKTDLDVFSALIAESLDGSKTVIAKKNKQREVVIDKLRILARYAEVTCKNDMEGFLSSGFDVAAGKSQPSQGLTENIRSIDHGEKSGETVIRLKKVAGAAGYELRYTPLENAASSTGWTTVTSIRVNTLLTLKDLKPATTYAFQVRTLGASGYSDWSDSITFIAT